MRIWCKTAIAAGAVLTALAGCKSSESASSPPPIKSAACTDPTASVVITDPTNYSLTDSFDIKTYTLKDNSNLVFDWSALHTDFFGHAVNPATDINMILVALWDLTPAEIEDALKKDEIPLNTMAGVISAYPDGTMTSATLQQDFSLLGQALPDGLLSMYFDTSTANYQYPQDKFTFMMMASTGTQAGKGPRGIALFHIDPSASASATTLAMTNDSTKLSYSVNLTQGAPMLVPAGTPKLTVDWSQMTLNMIGNKYDFTQITRAAVAHFKNATLEDLQSKFLDLETLADDWWQSTSIGESTVDLSTLAKTSGETFPGVDASGIWMTALFCDTCNNPAPWSITIMQPCQ